MPLAPYVSEIRYCDLSDENKDTMKKNGINRQSYKAQKMISDFLPRTSYVTHISNAKFYVEQGMRITKINRAIRFEHSNFASDFIEMTTKLRSEAGTKFEKALWKFINNVLESFVYF